MRKALLALALLPAWGLAASGFAPGTYRCWSFNAGGRGMRCTSPPIKIKKDGTYSMSGEKGTWKVKDGKVILSESKIRGPGRIVEDKLVFEYAYQGLQYTVTYLHQKQ